jgi:class II lanthipeptide synthase
MSDYRGQVEAAIRATVFQTPTTFSWFGKLSPQLTRLVRRALTPETARAYLLFNLQSQLYKDFYCRGFAAPARREVIGLPAVEAMSFVQQLSDANGGSGCWENGWEVRAIEGDRLVVQRRGLELRAGPDDYRASRDCPIEPGMRLSLRFPKELLNVSPGFYLALGDEELTDDDSRTLVRIYWNLMSEGAIQLIQSASTLLNQAKLPSRLKTLNDPTRYTRCDAAVLYVRQGDYDAVSAVLKAIYPELAAHLKRGTPVFTKRIAPGVGLAEDPGDGESFGLHRCRVLAEGLIRAYQRREKSIQERLRTVERCFAEHNVNLDAPFLNPGSSDIYNFQPPSQCHPQPFHEVKAPAATYPNPEALLQTAVEIGQRLAKQAIWHESRCNWIGGEPDESRITSGSHTKYSALGPELYAGTSGVAVFLAELHAATGDTRARSTALGATRHALSRADTLPPAARLGLYAGWTGIAFAAARVGTILGDEDLLHCAARLLHPSMHESRDGKHFDIITGSAGAIAGLLLLCEILNDASLLDFAVRLGDQLLETADKSDIGYSWTTPDLLNQRSLTGFSHGAAGVGHALLELFVATGDPKYRHAAEQAFNYERNWFDADAGNWPDFRDEPGQGKRGKRPLSFATAWCHGAPGIALSRLRAYEILKDETCKSEAIAALLTTYRTVEEWLSAAGGNYSLCHGLAGNAEVLLYGCQVLGSEWSDGVALAHSVANAGIETYAKRGHVWPCGTGRGETPSLMLGLSGIGYFYLRLHDAAIPSVLIFHRKKPSDWGVTAAPTVAASCLRSAK